MHQLASAYRRSVALRGRRPLIPTSTLRFPTGYNSVRSFRPHGGSDVCGATPREDSSTPISNAATCVPQVMHVAACRREVSGFVWSETPFSQSAHILPEGHILSV